MPRHNPTMRSLQVDLRPEILTAIRAAAQARGLSVSDWCREALTGALGWQVAGGSPSAITQQVRAAFTTESRQIRQTEIAVAALGDLLVDVLARQAEAQGVPAEDARREAEALLGLRLEAAAVPPDDGEEDGRERMPDVFPTGMF